MNAPRIHYEAGVLTAELFDAVDISVLEGIESTEFIRFDSPHLFFGGVNLAACMADGSLTGGADPRRGGYCRLV